MAEEEDTTEETVQNSMYNTCREEWRPVVGRWLTHEVSSWGRVRRTAAGQGAVAGQILSCYMVRGGYLRVLGHFVHKIVAEAFLGPCPEGFQINHRNGEKNDNRATNLEYVTRSENLRRVTKTGRPLLGDDYWRKRPRYRRREGRPAFPVQGEFLSLEGETWGIAKGTNGDYEVSNMGRLRRVSRDEDGFVVRKLWPTMVRNGITVTKLEFRFAAKVLPVHEMVADTFLGKCPKDHVIVHLDGDILNIRSANLEYVHRGKITYP